MALPPEADPRLVFIGAVLLVREFRAQHRCMGNDIGKKLFHAIVIAGAAIGGCGDDAASPNEASHAGTGAAPSSAGSAPVSGAGAGAGAGAGGTTLAGRGGAGGSTGGTSGGGAGGPPDAGADDDAEVRFPHITE